MDTSGKVLHKSNMSTPMPEAAIQSYPLYGEAQDLPDILHHEAIHTRASLYDWNIKPHRHLRIHQVFLFLEKTGTATIDGVTQRLESPTLLNVPAGTVHGFAFEHGMVGHVVTLPSELVDEVRAGQIGAIGEFFMGPPNERIRRIVDALDEEHKALRPERARMLTHWGGLLLGECARIGGARRGHRSGRTVAGATADQHLAAFDALLGAHFKARWSVADYAAALSLSPTHLNRIVRQARASSVSAEIESRTIREAKRLLAYTVLPVERIGEELGFTDPAHFSRRFKTVTGLSPLRYRANLER